MVIKIEKIFTAIRIRGKLLFIYSFQIPAIWNSLKIIPFYFSLFQINPVHLYTMHSCIFFHLHIFFLIEKDSINRFTTEHRIVYPFVLCHSYYLFTFVIRNRKLHPRTLEVFIGSKIIKEIGKAFIGRSWNYFFYNRSFSLQCVMPNCQRVNLFS